MKNILLIAFISILMAGCVPNPGPNDDVARQVGYIYYEGVTGGLYGEPVYKFEYDNHKYIRFGEYQSTCIVHDPDCKCHKNNNNNLFDW